MVYMRSEMEPLKDEELETAPAVQRMERSAAEKHTIITDGAAAAAAVPGGRGAERGGYVTAASARSSPGRR